MKRVLALTLLSLTLVTTYQCRSLRALRAELVRKRADVATAKAGIESGAEQLAMQQFDQRREELERTGMWLHEYYKSEDGLQRANGLWIDGHPDFAGISAWLFDVYLRHRIAGASEAVARQRVVEAIQQTAEWQLKHRPQGAGPPAGSR